VLTQRCVNSAPCYPKTRPARPSQQNVNFYSRSPHGAAASRPAESSKFRETYGLSLTVTYSWLRCGSGRAPKLRPARLWTWQDERFSRKNLGKLSLAEIGAHRACHSDEGDKTGNTRQQACRSRGEQANQQTGRPPYMPWRRPRLLKTAHRSDAETLAAIREFHD